MAFVAGIALRRFEHQRREHAHAVRDAHEVDADDPLPVLQRVLPDQAARAHAGVVEDEMRHAEARQRRRAHRLDLVRLRHVEAEREHLGAQRLDLRGGLVQRVLLHVGHHEVHAAGGGQARGLQAEARCRARDDRGPALERLHFCCPCLVASAFFNW